MAKKAAGKSVGPKSSAAKSAKKKAPKTGSNLQLLLQADAIDPDAANSLGKAAKNKIESLSKAEIKALISAHMKISPKQRWDPNPDGSIF